MSLKKNLTYSAVLTLSTYLMPLIVFPYISRVLGPDGVGTVDTVEYIINYAIVCSMMGLSIVGIREIAKARDNYVLLTKTFSELFFLNVISSLLVLAVLLVLIFFVPDFSQRKELFFIGMLKVVANLFWVEWFFKGIENFRYITVRSVIARSVFVVLVLLFINTRQDYVLYYVLWVGLTVMNAVCNWSYKQKYVALTVSNINLRHYLLPFLSLGGFAILSAVYTQLNVAFLGFACSDEEVGYYTTSTRLYTVIIALLSTLTGVMIPHISVLVKEQRFNEIKVLVRKVFNVLFVIAFPIVIFVELFAPDVIMLFAGEQFLKAVIPMRIVMLLVFVIGSEQIFIMQLLVPMQKDKEILYCAMAGMIVCLVVNWMFVETLRSVGSALAWLSAEFVVLLLSSFCVNRCLQIRFPVKDFLRHLLFAVPYVVLGWIVSYAFNSLLLKLAVAVLCFIAYFLLVEEKIFNFGLITQVVNKIYRTKR